MHTKGMMFAGYDNGAVGVFIGSTKIADCSYLNLPIEEQKANARRICQCANSHDKLLEACEFYADDGNYEIFVSGRTNVLTDGGTKAKAAIAQAKE